MEFWDENAAPAILAAVKAACKGVRGDLALELQERDRTRHVFLTEEVARLKDAATNVERLEEENQQLKQELESLCSRQRTPISGATSAVSSGAPETTALVLCDQQTAPAARRVFGEISGNKPGDNGRRDWEKEYESLAKRYAALEARFEAKQIASRKVRDDRNAWMKYAESLEAKLKKEKRRQQLREPVNSPVSSVAKKPAAPPGTSGDGTPLIASFTSNPETRFGLGEQDNVIQRSRDTRRAVSDPVTTTQQTEPAQDEETYDQSTAEDVVQPELPTLSPPLLSEHQISIKTEPLSDDIAVVSEREVKKRKAQDDYGMVEPPARRLKSENTLSSDPVVTGGSTTFVPQASMDFDAGPEAFPTPRRKRFQGVDAGHHNDVIEDGGRTVGAALGMRQSSDLSGIKQPQITGSRDRVEEGLVEACEADTAEPSSPTTRQATRAAIALDHASRRRKLDAPDRREPRPDEATTGSQLPAPQTEPSMETYTGDPFELDLVALRVLRERQEKQQMSARISAAADPSPKSSDSKSTARPQKNQNQEKRGKLRLRPLAELRPEDFKINPKFNNGHTFAFDEVVRDKASRAELPGCIDPNCCGKQFRAMAQSELDSGGTALLSREENIELMEDYLGDEAYRLTGMTLGDKRKLFLDVKTRDLANKYGRHRHRFARRPSPPGYWNPEFPSTQEMAKNKAEGQKIERGIVEERWREAMRAGGGRWLFRDE